MQDFLACLKRPSPKLAKIIKIKVFNIFDSYILQITCTATFVSLDIGRYSLSNYLVASEKAEMFFVLFFCVW